jgi:hypothetical protein
MLAMYSSRLGPNERCAWQANLGCRTCAAAFYSTRLQMSVGTRRPIFSRARSGAPTEGDDELGKGVLLG